MLSVTHAMQTLPARDGVFRSDLSAPRMGWAQCPRVVRLRRMLREPAGPGLASPGAVRGMRPIRHLGIAPASPEACRVQRRMSPDGLSRDRKGASPKLGPPAPLRCLRRVVHVDAKRRPLLLGGLQAKGAPPSEQGRRRYFVCALSETARAIAHPSAGLASRRATRGPWLASRPRRPGCRPGGTGRRLAAVLGFLLDCGAPCYPPQAC